MCYWAQVLSQELSFLDKFTKKKIKTNPIENHLVCKILTKKVSCGEDKISNKFYLFTVPIVKMKNFFSLKFILFLCLVLFESFYSQEGISEISYYTPREDICNNLKNNTYNNFHLKYFIKNNMHEKNKARSIFNFLYVSSLPANFHIPLTAGSTYSKNFDKLKVFDNNYQSIASNLSIPLQSINFQDSVTLPVHKQNAEIATSYPSLYEITNDEYFITAKDSEFELLYETNSTILSTKPQITEENKNNTKAAVKCSYTINSPNLSYNWININSILAYAKYSFLNLVLKPDKKGLFYMEYNSESNNLNLINVNSDNYYINNDYFEKLWIIEQKYTSQDFLVLGKKDNSSFSNNITSNTRELLVLTMQEITQNSNLQFNIIFNYYSTIQIHIFFYEQINKIGFYENQFILATSHSGIIILHQVDLNQINKNNTNIPNNGTNTSNKNSTEVDMKWTIKTTITNFKNHYTPDNNSYSHTTTADKSGNKTKIFKRNLEINNVSSSLNNISNNSSGNNFDTTKSLNNTKTSAENNDQNTSAYIYNVNIKDMLVNEKSIYLIVENLGLHIISLDSLLISDNFFYENENLYKLEFYNNIFLGTKYVGVYAENRNNISQEIFLEFIINDEFNPLVNKVFTSSKYIGKGKAAAFDDFFTFILNANEKSFYLIRKAMINKIPFITYNIDLSNIVKFNLNEVEFISLFDSVKNSFFYSLYSKNLIIPLQVLFVSDYMRCKFSQSGNFHLNFIQQTELCNESLNFPNVNSYCEKYSDYIVEIIGPPQNDATAVYTGILAAFAILLIVILTFLCWKTDGCRNLKYFKVKKIAQIRERIYYDPGQSINIEANKNKEILTNKVILENHQYIINNHYDNDHKKLFSQGQEENDNNMNKKFSLNDNNNKACETGSKSYKFIFSGSSDNNSENNNFPNNKQSGTTLNSNSFNENNLLETHKLKIKKSLKNVVYDDMDTNCDNKNVKSTNKITPLSKDFDYDLLKSENLNSNNFAFVNKQSSSLKNGDAEEEVGTDEEEVLKNFDSQQDKKIYRQLTFQTHDTNNVNLPTIQKNINNASIDFATLSVSHNKFQQTGNLTNNKEESDQDIEDKADWSHKENLNKKRYENEKKIKFKNTNNYYFQEKASQEIYNNTLSGSNFNPLNIINDIDNHYSSHKKRPILDNKEKPFSINSKNTGFHEIKITKKENKKPIDREESKVNNGNKDQVNTMENKEGFRNNLEKNSMTIKSSKTNEIKNNQIYNTKEDYLQDFEIIKNTNETNNDIIEISKLPEKSHKEYEDFVLVNKKEISEKEEKENEIEKDAGKKKIRDEDFENVNINENHDDNNFEERVLSLEDLV